MDAAGNPDQTPAGRTFTVATGAPLDTTITSGPSGVTDDATPTFTFTASAAGATFECRLGGAAFAACPTPHTLALADGAYTLSVRAVDARRHPG